MDAQSVKINSTQKIAVLLAVICLVWGNGLLYAQSDSRIRRNGKSAVKISLNAYSFNRFLLDKTSGQGMSLIELIDWCAAQGFDAVDLTGYYFEGYPNPPADGLVNTVKRHAFLQGLDISGTGVRNDFTHPDPEKRAADVELVKAWIDVAAKLGAPVIRIFAGPAPAGYEARWDEVATYVAASIKECTAYAAKRGVLVGLQNHGDFVKTADEAIKLINMVDSDWFGLVVDTGYFPYEDVEKAMPYAVNFQLKEIASGAAGPVAMDVRRVMDIVKRAGYRGYLPIETLPHPGGKPAYNPYTAIPPFLQQVKEAEQRVFK